MKRPQVLAADTATVAKVCLHVLNDLHSENQSPDFFCCIYATAFLTTPEDLIESFALLLSEPRTDFVMGVSEYNLPPVQALREEDGVLTPMWPELIKTQSQFQPKLVASNGTLYWAGVPAFFKAKSFYGERLKGYLIPKIRSIDIDTPEDLKIAKILSRNLLKKNKS
jgi:CMP-N-acetylneuraminic acid synthetase